MDFNLSELWHHTKESVVQLCPIIASINFRRRAEDDTNGSSPVKQVLIRAAISIVVASVIGVASGTISAYIMVNTMTKEIANLTKQVDRLEDRFYRYTNRTKE